MSLHTIDTRYAGITNVAAAYLIVDDGEATFVETNTTLALPHLLAALQDHGLTVDDVRYVIITHVHLDHAGGASALMRACPNATLLAHPRAAPHAIDPSKLVRSAKGVYGEANFAALYGEIGCIDADRVRVMADAETLRWQSRTWTFLHTRGHANHHFCIYDDVDDVVFTGDSFGIAYPLAQSAGLWVFPSSSPTDFDADAAIDSVRRLVDLGARAAMLTHFGAVTDMASAGDQIISVLERYGEWVVLADEQGLDAALLDTFMRDRVTALFERALAERGLPAEQLRSLLVLDVDLNAQGLAHAVRKRRYKRSLLG